jgi:hypothetical protein
VNEQHGSFSASNQVGKLKKKNCKKSKVRREKRYNSTIDIREDEDEKENNGKEAFMSLFFLFINH